MAVAFASEANHSPSSALGPRLPLAVSKAAIEFDRAIQGRSIGFESAKFLAAHLKAVLGRRAAEGITPTSFDSATIGIVGRAVYPDPSTDTTIADIVNEAWDLAEMMASTNADSDTALLERCKNFCVEFGNSLIQFSESLSQMQPVNPYKR